tara:strand:+ start:738 stop:1427 length:690 start_codon:yes stop_codon:yes gene_type:complete
MHGKWTVPAKTYAVELQRFSDELGSLQWAAPQDWMCEPHMLAKTGLTVQEHQTRTIASVLELRALGAPVIPVLQGWAPGDYWDHIEQYDKAGIDLRDEHTVGLGSVCRRQNEREIALLIRGLSRVGLRLHGFGIKGAALARCGLLLESADSMAWSFAGRRRPDESCPKRTCHSCEHYALDWRTKALDKIDPASIYYAPPSGASDLRIKSTLEANKRRYEKHLALLSKEG